MAVDTRYDRAVFLLRSWEEQYGTDYSYPDGSIGGHLCWLVDLPCIAQLMWASNLERLDFLFGPQPFLQYQKKLADAKKKRRMSREHRN